MDVKITEELDKAFWLPTKINELAQKGVKNVAHKMVPLLPELQRNRVLRAMEKAIQKEVETLREDEREEFETKVDKLPGQLPKKQVIVFQFEWYDHGDMSTYVSNRAVFTNELIAAQALLKYIQEYDYNKGPSTVEECLKLIQSKPSIIDGIEFEPSIRDGHGNSIHIYHIDCDVIKVKY